MNDRDFITHIINQQRRIELDLDPSALAEAYFQPPTLPDVELKLDSKQGFRSQCDRCHAQTMVWVMLWPLPFSIPRVVHQDGVHCQVNQKIQSACVCHSCIDATLISYLSSDAAWIIDADGKSETGGTNHG